MPGLKRLEIAGFKSFASRTSFHFSDGITAIVGPNGSGKSNVADALRWALGEQSGRLIRARKLEDVLFAGSSKRPASDKTEVSLVLDNSNGRLPLESSEVTITRRAQRSGESEYLINRKKVRLRDVQDLLAAGGSGQSSYSIIGQGLVESVLNLRPEERRQLIEEAADIHRYRARIESAHDRLAATHENMDRADLLIKEITPRLRQLERQAKRADDHQRISRELSQTLLAWYDHLWNHAQEALILSRAAHDQAQADHTQARVALETCQRELTSISEDLDKRRSALSTLIAERQQLAEQARELEQRLKLDQQRRGILQSRQQELSEELKTLEVDRARAAESVFDDSTRRPELEAQIQQAQRDLQTQKERLEALDAEFQGTQARAGAAEEKAARLRATASELEAKAQRLNARGIGREAGRLKTLRRSLVSQLAESVRILRNLAQQEAGIAGSAVGLTTRRDALQADVAQLHKVIANIETTQHGRFAKLEGLRARLQVIEEAQAHFNTAQAEGAAEPPDISLQGLLATVHQVIRVPRGLEKAIESALADYIEALIVERQHDALTAALAIAEAGTERTFILPLEGIKSSHPLNIMKEKGILGVAARLVKCDSQYQGVIDALLGRTIVVQDIEVGARVSRRGMGTVVTVAGVVFHPLGAVSAGVPLTKRPSFALSYERDIDLLPKEIEKTQRSFDVTARELENRYGEQKEILQQIEALDKEREDWSRKRAHLQQTLAERRQHLAHLRGEMRGVMAALRRVLEQSQTFTEEAAAALVESARLLSEAAETTETAEYLRKALRMVDSQRAEILEAITEASTRSASLKGELLSLADMRAQSEVSVRRLDTQLNAKQLQLRGLEMEISSLAASVLNSEHELEQANERLGNRATEVQPEQDTVAQSEARERELRSQLLTLQNRMLQSERRVLEAEAEARRWETELATMRQHIQDDGLTIGEQGEIFTEAEGESQVPYWLASGQLGDSTDRPRPIAGSAIIDPQELGGRIEKLRAQLRQIGPVNMEAQADYHELEERHNFLSGQLQDLRTAEESLHRAIANLSGLMEKRFEATFAQVSEAFTVYFRLFFGDGDASLHLSGANNNGVEITARPIGKRVKSLSQLSGGEKALTSVSFLFALLQTNPSPFCVLDEVDAMLDEANVGRFVGALQQLSERTQFIVISHNRKTIEKADCIYGVSMGPDNASKTLSLRLADALAN